MWRRPVTPHHCVSLFSLQTYGQSHTATTLFSCSNSSFSKHIQLCIWEFQVRTVYHTVKRLQTKEPAVRNQKSQESCQAALAFLRTGTELLFVLSVKFLSCSWQGRLLPSRRKRPIELNEITFIYVVPSPYKVETLDLKPLELPALPWIHVPLEILCNIIWHIYGLLFRYRLMAFIRL